MSKKILSFSEFYYGRRKRLSAEDIILFCESSKRFDSKNEKLSDAGALLLYEGETLSSWLVRTNIRLYKLIDDSTKESPVINWSVPLTDAQKGEVTAIPGRSSGTGKLSFSFREGKTYIYEPKLFQSLGVEGAISKFIGMDERPLRNTSCTLAPR